ncbi:MAG: membrane protein insertase YidC [Planctomycetota bacterium]|nr:membrane protein insertase YidC [Planctomycetota bacterium]
MKLLPYKLLVAALMSGLLVFTSARQVAAQEVEAVQSGEFTKQFGKPGEAGSFLVTFWDFGASVRSVSLLDNFQSVEGKRKESPEQGDYYKIVDMVEAGFTSLRLRELNPDKRRFPSVKLDVAPWEREELDDGGVKFTLDGGNGLSLEKTYRHEVGSRDLILEIGLRNKGYEGGETSIKLMLEGPTLPSPTSEHFFGRNPAVAIGRVWDGQEERLETARVDGNPNSSQRPVVAALNGPRKIAFAGSTNRFFASFLYPADDVSEDALYSASMFRLPVGRINLEDHGPWSVPQVLYMLRFDVPKETGGITKLRYRLYLGPKSSRIFGEHPDYEQFDAIVDTDLTPPCLFGCVVPGARPMGKFLLWILRLLHDMVPSWGVAIILLTLIVRSLVAPLNFRMQKSMRVYGAKMARLAPQLEEIKKKFGSDKKRYQQAMVEFQKQHKMFPPIGGCLPLFITLPVFLGLFTTLRVAYDLRLESFLYVADLSKPDALFELGLSFMPHFNLLPLLWMALFAILSFSQPLPKDPQQRQMGMIMRGMPFLFGVMLYNYAAGLMVYLVTSSLVSLIEARVTKKILGPMPQAGAGVPQMPTL